MDVNREMEERRLLDMVKKAVARVKENPLQHDSFIEIAVVQRALHRHNETWPGFMTEMTGEIIKLGHYHALIYASTLSQLLSNLDAQLEDIGEGIEFEHDGSKFVAVEVDVLKHAKWDVDE